MKLDIAIVNYNTDFYLLNLLASIAARLPVECLHGVHVWDNGSRDRSLEVLEAFGRTVPWLHVHASAVNVHHGAALDALLRTECDRDWVLVLDSDTAITRDFLPCLPALVQGNPAFVGQVQPYESQLYAYLAHVLINRTWYLSLPGFTHHGAPGVDFFRAIEERHIPYRPFRWCDYVRHFGQGTLRQLVERGETANEFYKFARRERRIAPGLSERAALEVTLKDTLEAFLLKTNNGRSAVGSRAAGTRTEHRADGGAEYRADTGVGPYGVPFAVPATEKATPARAVRRFDSRSVDRATLYLAVLVSAGLALHAYVQYLGVARLRWDGIVHDRNGHYAYGLSMAAALRDADIFGFLSALEKGKVWPPLHGVMVALVSLAGGFDYRLAVLPSLLGFLVAMVCGFLIAQRLVPGRRASIVAGIVALIFIANSPAHRAYATDVMLESLGAGLTLVVLYLYVVAAQGPQARHHWRAVAIVLTLLFFTKYNYWAIIVLALATAWILSNGHRAAAAVVAGLRSMPTRWLAEQLRHPLIVIAAGLVGIAVAILVRGPTSVEWQGIRVSLYPPNNILTAAYVLVLVRVVSACLNASVNPVAQLAPASQAVVRWHVAPLLASFALPDRLALFLWSLTSSHGAEGPWAPGASVRLYAAALANDYHASLFSVVAAIGLVAVAIVRRRHLHVGALPVLVLPAVGLLLCIGHPRIESRMMHTWVAVLWIAAGAGLGSVVVGAERARGEGSRLPRAVAVASVVLLLVIQGSRALGSGHSSSAGHQGVDASLLDITDTYLPHLAGSQRPAILATVACRPLLAWTFLARYPLRRDLELPHWETATTRDDLRRAFDNWIATTRSDTVVLVDIRPGSYFDVRLPDPVEAAHRAVGEFMRSQHRFQETGHWGIDRYGVTVTLWRLRLPER